MSKLSANAFLAQRISSINTISAICERTGANIKEVSLAVGMDHRIGKFFLNSGPGFGGSCFKKDLLSLIYLSKFYGLNEVAEYWNQVIKTNSWHKKRISRIILQNLFGNLKSKKIAILGFVFKADTNDTRESPAIDICKDLLVEGAYLAIYDPKVNFTNVAKELNSDNQEKTFIYRGEFLKVKTIKEAITNADAIVVLTEWEEFRSIQWNKYADLMRKPSWIFDSRDVINEEDIDSKKINLWKCGYDLRV